MGGRRTKHDNDGSDRRPRSRRQFLQAVAVASTPFIAGCSGGEDDESQSPTAIPEQTTTATPTDSPTTTETVTGPDPERLEQQAIRFLERLANGNFEAGYELFAPPAKESVTVSTLEQEWSAVVAESGEYIEVVEAAYEGDTQNAQQIVVEVRFSEKQQRFDVLANAEGILSFLLSGGAEYGWQQPSYADRAAFSDQSVTLTATESCDLGGTLSIPDGSEECPGVVIVHGSGPNDRDGTLGPSKPYKELAWGLASKGVGVLRYDKRTAACSGDGTDITIDGVVTDDALTALDKLRNHDRIAADEVFVAGHSLGGKMVPRIATRDDTLAGAIMLAAPARGRADIIVDQVEYLLSLEEDLSDTERQQQLETIRQQAEKIRTLDIADDELVRGAGRPFWRTLQEYDQTATAAALNLPLLLAQGRRDYQVTVEDELSVWREVLSENSNASFEVYDNLNHLFEQSEGEMSPDEYYRPDSPVAETVIDDLAAFVEKHA
ncbi:alpha/beta hydrolase [Halovenus salina]|uniref:alpha/beta hydrolase n=1 Tax=Halovenus salina TaxID=1510225 RepID=UPI002260E965|nr:alpha/beta fold hydrolase [Halovenus salina]